MEELKALKFADEVESSDSKGKGKESVAQQDERGQDDYENDRLTKNFVVDLDEQEQEHNPKRH